MRWRRRCTQFCGDHIVKEYQVGVIREAAELDWGDSGIGTPKAKERRKTVRAKRPVQQPQHAIGVHVSRKRALDLANKILVRAECSRRRAVR